MYTDFELGADGSVAPAGGHGGARRNAGRRPGSERSPEVLDLDKAKARNEAAKADQNELDFKIKSGQYVSRAAVQEASATAVAGMAQTLRSLRDRLESRGIPLDVCDKVDAVVQEALAEMAAEMELMSGSPE